MKNLYIQSKDESELIGLSRIDFMKLRKMLREPKKLSIDITSTDLANVVNGRDDIELPEWSKDEDFELEIENLIEQNQLVWICPECDKIVAFFETTEEINLENLVRRLLVVAQRDDIPCPYCGKIVISLFDTDFLKRGLSVKEIIPKNYLEKLRTTDHKTKHKLSKQSEDSNEKFLQEVLEKYHGQSEDASTDIFVFSDYSIMNAKMAFKESITTWKEGPGIKPLSGRGSLDDTFIPEKMPLRPRYGSEDSNVLGRIWDSVILMTRERYPEFKKIAVGIAKSNGLYCTTYRNETGNIAIVLHFGLFTAIYSLNHLFDLILHFNESHGRDFNFLIDNFVECLKNIDTSSFLDSASYKSEEEFWRSHFISNCQQQFVILHELGHIVEWTTEKRTCYRRRKMENHKKSKLYNTNSETKADMYALKCIIEKGGDFNEPWVQYRSIFWLFEYWHMLEKRAKVKDSVYNSARERWDNLYKELKKCRADLSSLHMNETRKFVDRLLFEGLS